MTADGAIRVDCHAHVYDLAAHAIQPSSGFDTLPCEIGTPDQFNLVLDAHGFTHALLVNPLGGYGTDNSCLLSVLQKHKGRFKGVVVLEHGTTEKAFDEMTDAGVIGLRFNLNFPSSPALNAREAPRTLDLARERGWFVQVHYEGDSFFDALPILINLKQRLVIDHCGRPDITAGLRQPAFQALLNLGRYTDAIIKLSGAFRFSTFGFPFQDVDPFVEALIDAFTLERCVWGSDWPFIRAKQRMDHASVLAALARWIPNAEDQEKVLSRNPQRLFGFANPPAYRS
jgi:predicted TIM-barrel fold metal-dependent hydrolase